MPFARRLSKRVVHGAHRRPSVFFAAFNLLTLRLYGQIRAYGRGKGKDVTRTICALKGSAAFPTPLDRESLSRDRSRAHSDARPLGSL